MKSSIKREILSWVGVIMSAVAVAMALNFFVIIHAEVPTGSMIPTILEHSRIVAFRLSYLFDEPLRYDVVVFPFPDDETQYYVKRIIGLPGEFIDIVDGKVYIDGSSEALDDHYLNNVPVGDGHYEVPYGHYFMMGDNRNYSSDSRAWDHAYLKREKILGKVIFTYYPEIKLIK